MKKPGPRKIENMIRACAGQAEGVSEELGFGTKEQKVESKQLQAGADLLRKYASAIAHLICNLENP